MKKLHTFAHLAAALTTALATCNPAWAVTPDCVLGTAYADPVATTCTVPAGVVSLNVVAVGGGGGGSVVARGGHGGKVVATLTVTPGQALNLFVGGGGTAVLSSDGGGGGGSSNVDAGTANQIIAGGGGGAGGNGDPGGDAGGVNGVGGNTACNVGGANGTGGTGANAGGSGNGGAGGTGAQANFVGVDSVGAGGTGQGNGAGARGATNGPGYAAGAGGGGGGYGGGGGGGGNGQQAACGGGAGGSVGPAGAVYSVGSNGGAAGAAGGGNGSILLTVNTAPVASAVSIAGSGSAQLSVQLTGSHTYTDANNDLQGTSIFRWLSGTQTSVGTASAIGSANSVNYTPVGADVGKYLFFCVTPVAQTGATPGTEVCSQATSAVIGAPINGVCGSLNGPLVMTPPSGSAFCVSGTPSSIGTNPLMFSWTCNGVNNGTNSGQCSVERGYAVSGTANPPAGGTVTCTPAIASYNGSSTCTTTTNPGYTFSGWGGDCTGTGPCSFTGITVSKNVTANFTVNTFQINVTSGSGGTATCSPSSVTSGGSSTCTATPNTGYTFSGWSGDCAGTSTTCTLNNVTSNKNAAASFTASTYTVTATSGPGGTATCSPSPVSHGGNSTCTATANTGYTFSGWSGDCTGTSTTCTLSNVTSNKNAAASFTASTYTVTATSGSGGTATCSPSSVTSGGSSTCTATPNTGYTFSSWSGDCAGTASTCTLSNVTSNKNAAASFAGNDATPDAFSFTAANGVALSTLQTSNTITVAGINTGAAISITGGEYQIGSGSFVSTGGTVNNGNTVTVRHTSSGTHSTATTTRLTIGGVSADFVSTTVAATVVNGACGSSANVATAFLPTANLCSAGTASTATPGTSSWAWSCAGTGPSAAAATCSAPYPPVVNGGGTVGTVQTPGTNGWQINQAASGFVALPAPAPVGVTFPGGATKVVLSTGTAGTSTTVTLRFSSIPAGAQLYKYGKENATDVTEKWFPFPATIDTVAGTVTYTLTDGQRGDNDWTVNSVIDDPVALAAPAAAAAVGVEGVPTLSQWGMMLLAALMALATFLTLRRRTV